jgi:hypothetical protein
VFSKAEYPAFVRCSLVHQSLQTTKDVATKLAVPAPTTALMEAEASSIGIELGEHQTGTDQQTISRAHK